MPDTDTEKLLQHLNEAHALEAGLVQTLTAHIAVTPAGPYRDLLERHLRETRAQTTRLEERLGELGVTKSPIQAVVGIAETVIGQLIPAAKLPWDLLRGSTGEEKLFKNAKDEAASEALEIATYDGLEAVAHALGDEKTATLAREHRTQEEVFLKDLRELIPALATDVIDAQVKGEPSYDPGTTGAADAAKQATKKAKETAGRFQRDDEPEAEQAAPKQPERKHTGDLEEVPIEDYDSLTVDQVLPKLEDLDAEELAAIDGVERATKERKRVLDRISALRKKRVDEELARIG